MRLHSRPTRDIDFLIKNLHGSLDEDRRAMRIQIPIHPAFLNDKKEVEGVKNDNGGNGGKSGGNIERLSENENRVYLQVTENGAQTAKQISDKTGIPKRTVERILKKLKDSDYIMRIGSSRSGRWEKVQIPPSP